MQNCKKVIEFNKHRIKTLWCPKNQLNYIFLWSTLYLDHDVLWYPDQITLWIKQNNINPNHTGCSFNESSQCIIFHYHIYAGEETHVHTLQTGKQGVTHMYLRIVLFSCDLSLIWATFTSFQSLLTWYCCLPVFCEPIGQT